MTGVTFLNKRPCFNKRRPPQYKKERLFRKRIHHLTLHSHRGAYLVWHEKQR